MQFCYVFTHENMLFKSLLSSDQKTNEFEQIMCSRVRDYYFIACFNSLPSSIYHLLLIKIFYYLQRIVTRFRTSRANESLLLAMLLVSVYLTQTTDST